MPRGAEARAWWADVEDVRERIERRRALEREARRTASTVAASAARRGVREIRPGRRLLLVETAAPPVHETARERSRSRPRLAVRVGPRPDMIAAWAVVLGMVLLAAAILSTH